MMLQTFSSVRVQKSAPLGRVLADESVGVLVEPTLPRMLGMGKVALCVEFFGDDLMIGELLAVVIGEGVNKVRHEAAVLGAGHP